MRPIRQATVIGAGTMGAQIAAHLANVGVEVALLDVAPTELTLDEIQKGWTLATPEVRQRVVRALFARMVKLSPPPFFVARFAERVRLGNIDDDWACIGSSDWIVEAVVERLEIKRDLHRRLAAAARPDALVTTNTSGLPIQDIVAGLPEDYRRRVFGSHFFNPPRYMRLLELVPHAGTDVTLLADFSGFAEEVLGKGVVVAKDTPGFIANRIGCFDLQQVLWMAERHGKSVEEVDALTGPLIGRPGSATFRLCDLIGIDLLAQLCRNLQAALPGAAEKKVFAEPPFVTELVARGWLGEKSGRGFYERTSRGSVRSISALDLKTLAYRPQVPPAFSSLRPAAAISNPIERLKAVCAAEGPEAAFVWEHLSATLCYAADVLPEIADSVVAVDRAMRWGFNWQLGPFEMWDALGVASVAPRLTAEGRPVPLVVQQILQTPSQRFYPTAETGPLYFDLATRASVAGPSHPSELSLARLRSRSTVRAARGASLVDLGDGVACLEFHSKANAIDVAMLDLLLESLEIVRRDFAGLVIGNQGTHFSAGADLRQFLTHIEAKNWAALRAMLTKFQSVSIALRSFERPVLAAVHGYALGGGCEIALGCHEVVAAGETMLGFPEVKVGLIPGAHGTKEMLRRFTETISDQVAPDYFAAVRAAWELIFSGRISGSAAQALDFRLLRPAESVVVMNPARLIGTAKARVLVRARTHRPAPPEPLPAIGATGVATLRSLLDARLAAGEISQYDVTLGTRLAHVLCGGELAGLQFVPESYVLELEREAFLGLCGEPHTVARIRHMLETGKPLEN